VLVLTAACRRFLQNTGAWCYNQWASGQSVPTN